MAVLLMTGPRSRHAVLSCVLPMSFGVASAQQVVTVGNGQLLTQAHLDAGLFGGQPFTLGPSTTFEINAGGSVDQLRGGINPDTGTREPYDLLGATFNINDGGVFESELLDQNVVGNITLNIREGGSTGAHARFFPDSEINVLGGVFGFSPSLHDGVVLRIEAGSAGGQIELGNYSSAVISGGMVGSQFGLGFESTINISGGVIGSRFQAAFGSTVNLFVRDLTINGTPIELKIGMPYLIEDRDSALLVATLADGSVFDYILNTINVPGEDSIHAETTLTATRVAMCPADVNGDGVLTPADFSAWIVAFNTQSSACDQNGDGACTPNDFSAWVANYNTGCP